VLPIRFTPEAEADLAEIFDYTVRVWSIEQAISYVSDLRAACKQLIRTPRIGRDRRKIRTGLRSLDHAKHIVYYLIEGDRILVVRILHERMKPTRKRFSNLP
jgi:toxin ParE1/3/4